MLLSKGTKSLQLSLNELIPKLGLTWLTVSNAAYSKARHKLKHTAFIELNQEAVVRTMYEDGDYRTCHGLRILAVDGSLVMVPMNKETIDVFGTRPYTAMSNKPGRQVKTAEATMEKQAGTRVTGKHSFARASVLYDVMNKVVLDAQLAPCDSYEGDLAAKHLAHTGANDLAIYDRGYCSYRMLARASVARGNFLIRCASGRFPIATAMLCGEGADDVIVELTAPKQFLNDPLNSHLSEKLTVRFVRVTLEGGGYEVLVTSLTNREQYPLAIFKELYYLRWSVETFYGILKTRLLLENFSGLSVEAVRQDFYATIFLCGMESIFTDEAEETLRKQTAGQHKKVNKAVSFNVIKYRAFELFMSKQPQEQLLEELTELFLASPTRIRPGRKPPRVRHPDNKVLGFWKRSRKSVF